MACTSGEDENAHCNAVPILSGLFSAGYCQLYNGHQISWCRTRYSLLRKTDQRSLGILAGGAVIFVIFVWDRALPSVHKYLAVTTAINGNLNPTC